MRQFVAAIVLGAGLAAAQQVIEEKRIEIRRGPGSPADVLMWSGPVAGMGAQTFEFVSAEGIGPQRLVKGAPYSADTTTESVQTLADGNRITQKSTSSFYRDSEGRTRREMSVEAAGEPNQQHKIVMIDDPVAGVHYLLNTREKTATKMTLAQPGQEPHFSFPPMIAGGPGGPGAVKVMRSRVDGIEPKAEDLGSQRIEGVQAQGKRTTITIPAGQMGNERPLVSHTEIWFSDELKTPILVKRVDQRMGETTSRTTNIRRVEQPRYLFDIPADFKVEESKPRTLRIERKGGEL